MTPTTPNLSWLLDREVDDMEKYRACRAWLRRWSSANLDAARRCSFVSSRFTENVTLIAYVFYPNAEDFFEVEFSILHTWRVLGRLPVVLVVDRLTRPIESFSAQYADCVRVSVSCLLKPGDVDSMGADCVANLYRYFDTPYCLVIQNDGFPLHDGLAPFLCKFDYIGAPSVLDSWRQGVADLLLKDCLNGGFSLRSKRCCELAARVQGMQAHKYPLESLRLEDHFYCQVVRQNLWHRMRLKFPWAWQARRFSVIDFYGTVDVRSLRKIPFGIHGPTTVFQFMNYLNEHFEYKVVP